MNRIRRILLAAGAAAAGFAPAAHACSMLVIPTAWDGAHLIATATPDTVLAGYGSGLFRRDPEQPAAGGERGIYGQVVRVERVAGPQAAALPASADRAVLVPWDHDPLCRATPYRRSARWVQPGERGLFWAVLRRRDQWVDGVPTFDVGDPDAVPYTPRRHAVVADSLMSVDQAFGVMRLLPRSGDYENNGEAAYGPLLAWAGAHPRLARLYPANGMARGAEHRVRLARVRRIAPPLAGTYRFRVTVNGGAPWTFYARTRSTAAAEWNPDREPDPRAEPPGLDVPIPGYAVMLVAVASADSLPAACEPGRHLDRWSSFFVAAAPRRGADGARVWRGQVELRLPARAFPRDSVLTGIERDEQERMFSRAQAGLPVQEPPRAPARFLVRPDGSVTVEQTRVLDDGRIVVITGERLSRVTIPHPGVVRACGQ